MEIYIILDLSLYPFAATFSEAKAKEISNNYYGSTIRKIMFYE